MLDIKLETLLAVAESGSFTRAAERLALTQPAVSHHVAQLENELGCKLFLRGKKCLIPTESGEIALRYARRLQATYAKMVAELEDVDHRVTRLRIGLTHTAESNQITEAFAKYGSSHQNISITIVTDTIKNLYEKLENHELDMAVVEGKPSISELNCLMLDTDYLVCILSVNNPLAHRSMVTLNDLRNEKMILRLPSSATRMLFEAALLSSNASIDELNIALEVDNIATIKDLIRKDLGISVLPKSACMDEIKKGKLIALPIENLSMLRETNIVYHKDFSHMDLLGDLVRVYRETARLYS